MSFRAINFDQKFALLQQTWQPRVIAEMNDYQFKLVRLHGNFIWHDHKDTDEAFIVLDGVLRIDFDDGAVQGCKSRPARCSSCRKACGTSRTPKPRSSCC